MAISTKGSEQINSSDADNCDMGLLFVFFPEEEHAAAAAAPPPQPRKLVPCSPASSSSSSPSPSLSAATTWINNCNISPPSFKRRRSSSSSSNRLLAKAQSTISICALLVFITLFVFALSTFEPTSAPVTAPRRLLSRTAGTPPAPVLRLQNLWGGSDFSGQWGAPKHQFALQGMGTLHRRGTGAMDDLVVAHVTETATEGEVRLFLRALHRSILMSRADLVLILCSRSPSLDSVIREENDSFSRLLRLYGELNGTAVPKPAPMWSFDVNQFVRPVKSKDKEIAEPLWGKRTRSNFSDAEGEGESTRLSYGSVVSFEAAELDPENSLAGFLNHVPMSLRRWGCYQMLLGRVRRSFKHVMLVDARSSVVVGNPLVRVRSRRPESVYLLDKPDGRPSRHGRKSPEKAQGSHGSVDPGVIMGGARGMRRLAATMLAEIVRAATQHKRRGPVTDSAVLSQVAGNEHLLRNVDVVMSNSDNGVIQRGNDLSASLIMKQICSQEMDSSSVYKDCR